jgi:hypothetical protein
MEKGRESGTSSAAYPTLGYPFQKMRINDGSNLSFSLLFQCQAGEEKVSYMAVYSFSFWNGYAEWPVEGRSGEKVSFKHFKKVMTLGMRSLQVVLLRY